MSNDQRLTWITVGVTALPAGWRNVYRVDSGALISAPCAALLLQEQRLLTSDYEIGQALQGSRVCYADESDGFGELVPAIDGASNYLGTCGPGEDPTIFMSDTG